MLFSIVLSPLLDAIQDPHCDLWKSSRLLTRVLSRISTNGVILTVDVAGLRKQLAECASIANQLQINRASILLTEYSTNISQYACSVPSMGPQPNDSVVAIALEICRQGRADAIVTPSLAACQQFIDAGAPAQTVLDVSSLDSLLDEHIPWSWPPTARLDRLAKRERDDLIGRVIRYATQLTIADKMIGVSAKDNAKRVLRYMRGLEYFVECWSRFSPFASHRLLDIEIVTVAGRTGAKGGYIDPKAVRSNIDSAIRQTSILKHSRSPIITLKQDAEPSVFNDRLLRCRARTWGIHHGLDYFGDLRTEAPARPTMLDLSSDARDSVYRDIKSLKTIM